MADVRAEFFSLYGSLFFLGILLSVLFLFATLLMLYYKQVVEGMRMPRALPSCSAWA